MLFMQALTAPACHLAALAACMAAAHQQPWHVLSRTLKRGACLPRDATLQENLMQQLDGGSSGLPPGSTVTFVNAFSEAQTLGRVLKNGGAECIKACPRGAEDAGAPQRAGVHRAWQCTGVAHLLLLGRVHPRPLFTPNREAPHCIKDSSLLLHASRHNPILSSPLLAPAGEAHPGGSPAEGAARHQA